MPHPEAPLARGDYGIKSYAGHMSSASECEAGKCGHMGTK